MGYNGMKEYAKVKDGRDFVYQINEKTKGTLMRRLSQHQMRREQDVVQTMRNLLSSSIVQDKSKNILLKNMKNGFMKTVSLALNLLRRNSKRVGIVENEKKRILKRFTDQSIRIQGQALRQLRLWLKECKSNDQNQERSDEWALSKKTSILKRIANSSYRVQG